MTFQGVFVKEARDLHCLKATFATFFLSHRKAPKAIRSTEACRFAFYFILILKSDSFGHRDEISPRHRDDLAYSLEMLTVVCFGLMGMSQH